MRMTCMINKLDFVCCMHDLFSTCMLSFACALLIVCVVSVACRNRMLDERLAVPRLYFYSTDDKLCDTKELETLLDRKQQQYAFNHAACAHSCSLICSATMLRRSRTLPHALHCHVLA